MTPVSLFIRSAETEAEETESHPPPERATAVWEAKKYLADMYPACMVLLRQALNWDVDGDGLIENSGFPDQTFDAWVMSGPRCVHL